MPDYINRDWLLNLYDESKLTEEEKSYGAPFNVVRQNILDAPTVIRCKDCRFNIERDNGTYGCYRWFMDQHEPQDFCSYGERKKRKL